MSSEETKPEESGSYETSKDYASAVREWMRKYYEWQQLNCFVAWSVMQQYQMLAAGKPSEPVAAAVVVGTSGGGGTTPAGTEERRPPVRPANNTWSVWFLNQLENINQYFQPHQPDLPPAAAHLIGGGAGAEAGNVYKVASVYHRIAAEAIDFFILFFLKILITYVAVDTFDLIDISKYDIELWVEGVKDRDFINALDFTTDILILETIHRTLVCIYEALFTYQGYQGSVGGGTPGKRIFGLKIVCFQTLMPLGGGYIIVVGPENMGFVRAMIRSVVKNFSMAFFFPLSLTMFFGRHNRAVYDTLSNSVVVNVRDRYQQPVRGNQAGQQQPAHPHQD